MVNDYKKISTLNQGIEMLVRHLCTIRALMKADEKIIKKNTARLGRKTYIFRMQNQESECIKITPSISL